MSEIVEAAARRWKAGKKLAQTDDVGFKERGYYYAWRVVPLNLFSFFFEQQAYFLSTTRSSYHFTPLLFVYWPSATA